MHLRVLLAQYAPGGTGLEANSVDLFIPESELPKAMSIAQKAGALTVELLDEAGEVLKSMAARDVLSPTVQA